MTLSQALEKALLSFKESSTFDFCLLSPEGAVLAATGQKKLPSQEKQEEFLSGSALCVYSAGCQMHKITLEPGAPYLLFIWGRSDTLPLVGELAVCQVTSLLEAYREHLDKNSFMQNLLLGSYTGLEAQNKAKKLHISEEATRLLFLVETKQTPDENILSTIRSLFSSRNRDYITITGGHQVAIIRESAAACSPQEAAEMAHTLVDTLGAEAMTLARVAYSHPCKTLSSLPAAYREACTALEIGRIFYASKSVFNYSSLGIGRLIHQLPRPICEMFLKEVFPEESLDSLDEETLTIIRTFFENNLNLSETARKLYVHRNTLVYRFEKLEKKFGLDIRTFEDALTFKIASMVADYLHAAEGAAV